MTRIDDNSIFIVLITVLVVSGWVCCIGSCVLNSSFLEPLVKGGWTALLMSYFILLCRYYLSVQSPIRPLKGWRAAIDLLHLTGGVVFGISRSRNIPPAIQSWLVWFLRKSCHDCGIRLQTWLQSRTLDALLRIVALSCATLAPHFVKGSCPIMVTMCYNMSGLLTLFLLRNGSHNSRFALEVIVGHWLDWFALSLWG